MNGVTVAKENNFEYRVTIYSDGSGSLDYIATAPGCSSGIWCGLLRLKAHMERNAYIMGKDQVIPHDWEIIRKDFFEALGIA